MQQQLQNQNVSVNSMLRIRPLEQKHKLKEDYFEIRSQNQREEQKYEGPLQNVITIHDPLKRSKEQYEFKLNKIFTQDKSNAAILADQQAHIDKLLKSSENQLIFSFGHKDCGKTYSLFGENNYQLERNLNDVDIQSSDDSRGLVLRYAHAILERDTQARLGISFVDIVMDNIRDLLKYVKKEQRKTQNSATHFGGSFEEPIVTRFADSDNNPDYNISQAHSIEKDFLEIHERPGNNNSIYYLKNLTYIDNIKDLSEIAYFIDKGTQQSEILNKKLNYTPGLRPFQIFQLAVRGSKNGKDCQLIFIDLPDYEKLQTNIIDNQKLYESIVINNTFNSVANLISGFNNKRFDIQNAPFDNSKLTRIIQSILQQSHPQNSLNINFYCCIWPIESKYSEVVDTLKFLDRISRVDQLMEKQVYQGEMSTNQEKIMQEISRENVEIKFRIDSFRREHAHKLKELQAKLGLDLPIDNILKSKGNQKELQQIKEHKDAIDKTEQYTKLNKDIERKLEAMQQQMQENELAKREIQENFSQKYYIIHKKIDKLREEYKQSEMELDHTLRGQINDRNEELQKILNNTHAMLIENSGLVDQLKDTVVKKTQGTKNGGEIQSKRINFMKDEGKRDAEDNYQKLLQQQIREFETQLQTTQQTQEHLLKKKEEELDKASKDFKKFHSKVKNDQGQARSEIVKLYNIAKRQNQILSNIENGVYSQTAKRVNFNSDQKPALPDPAKFKFLYTALEKQSQKGIGSMMNSVITGQHNLVGTNSKNFHINEYDEQEELFTQNIDAITNPDDLRVYVKQLMGELGKHSQSHPKILKGENVEQVLKEIETHKREYEKASKKNNDVKIQIEAQRRLIERIQMENFMVPGQPNLHK